MNSYTIELNSTSPYVFLNIYGGQLNEKTNLWPNQYLWITTSDKSILRNSTIATVIR